MTKSGFAEIAARLDYPMLVATVSRGDEHAGCLVGFHSQCSIDPVRYSIWISRANYTLSVARGAGVFALHFLDAESQVCRDLAELFGGTSGDTRDKFESCAWHLGPAGAPLLDGCPNRSEARCVVVHDSADCDHVCFVLELRTIESTGALSPLMYSQVKYIEPGHEVS